MNKNIAIILSIAAILITLTCVGATVINSDGDMKQNTFDGIKINVPHDAKFIQIPDGFKENTYGITIHTFKDNQSIVNFLNSLQNAKIVSLPDQPPQSVAFTQGDTTNILVTNGKEGICVGAPDQNLVLKMANSVIFSNGHPSERNHGVMGVGQKHLDKDKDFNLMVGILALVDNTEINIDNYNTAIITTVDQTNIDIDEGNIDIDENNTDMDSNISDITEVVNVSDSSSDNPTESGDMVNAELGADNSVDSMFTSSPNSQPSSESGDSSSSSDEEPLSKSECKEMVISYLSDSNYDIDHIEHKGDIYIFYITDDNGEDIGTITVDSITKELDDTGLSIK